MDKKEGIKETVPCMHRWAKDARIEETIVNKGVRYFEYKNAKTVYTYRCMKCGEYNDNPWENGERYE